MHIHAAAELYKRQYRYHKELQTWFTQQPVPGVGPSTPGGFVFFEGVGVKQTHVGGGVKLCYEIVPDLRWGNYWWWRLNLATFVEGAYCKTQPL